MQVQPYIMLEGRSDEAIAFYRDALGAEVTMLMRFKEAPDQSMMPPGSAEKVMHAQLKVGNTEIMISDGRCAGKANFQGFALAVSADTPDAAERMFGALSQGGQVQMPLAQTFFAKRFGMVADRFGVSWMVLVPA